MMRREFDPDIAGIPLGQAPFSSAHSRKGAVRSARAPELSPARARLVYGIGLGLWITGAVWLVAHYFMVQDGPYGPSPHPLEFWSIAAHGAFGFASLWLLGLLWSVHIPAGWRSLRRRWSGSIMFGLSALLVLSGYLLYYLGSEDMIPIVAVLHWGIGLACPALFLAHRFTRDSR